MAKLPAILSGPSEMDTTPGTIHAAMGVALINWEHMEANYSSLFSVFETGLLTEDGQRAYGRNKRISRDRFAALQNAAEQYFVRKPNQDLEGELAKLIEQSTELSIQRHRVAHGVIYMTLTTPDREFEPGEMIVPFPVFSLGVPTYAQEQLEGHSWGGMGSKDILGIADGFFKLAQRAETLLNQIVQQS